jgi:hypothetical protein
MQRNEEVRLQGIVSRIGKEQRHGEIDIAQTQIRPVPQFADERFHCAVMPSMSRNQSR